MKRRSRVAGVALLAAALALSLMAPGALVAYVWRVALVFLLLSGLCMWLSSRTRPQARAWPEHAESGDFAGIDVEWRTLVPGFWRVEATSATSALTAQGWFSVGRHRLRLEERVARRGIHVYAVQLVYLDPFGLFSRRLAWKAEAELAVRPRTVPLGRIGAMRELQGALVGARRAQRSDAPAGVRRYLPGDRLAEVHWPQTLRTGEVQVRDAYTRGTSLRTIALDTRRSAYPDEHSFELAVSVAASLALSLSRRGDAVELAAGERLLPARLATQARIMDLVTRVALGDGGEALATSARSLVYVGSAQGAAAVRSQRPLAFTIAVGRGAQGEDLSIPDWPALQRLGRSARAAQ